MIGIIQQDSIKIGSRADATTTMSAEHSEEPSDDEESFDPEADGVLVAKLPWRVEPSKRGR